MPSWMLILIPWMFVLPIWAAPIKIAIVSDLDFGSGGAGDPAKTVLPGTSETSSNGSFNVTGDPNVAYTITLPTSITMTTTGGGGATRSITVNNFQSFPAAGANGLLSPAGSQMLYLGATRAALLSNQVAGSYSGTVRVTVVY